MFGGSAGGMTGRVSGTRSPAYTSLRPARVAPGNPALRINKRNRRNRAIIASAKGIIASAKAVNIATSSTVLFALSSLLSSLGMPLDPAILKQVVRKIARDASGGTGGTGGTGGGGGGNGGSGNNGRWTDADYARVLIDIFFGASCLSCKLPCSLKKVVITVNSGKVGKAMEYLVTAMDAALRKYKRTSLMQETYNYLTNRIDGKLKQRGIPLRIRPTLKLGRLLQYDATRGIRLKVLEYVASEYIDYYLGYYLPKTTIKYNIADINAEIFSRFRPQALAFLSGRDSDLAPLMGWLTKYLVDKNMPYFKAVHPACLLCKQIPKVCKKKKKKKKTVAVK